MLSGWLMLLKLPDGPKNPVITHPAPAIDLPSSDIADEGVATPWPEAGLKLALVPRSWPQNRPSIKATCLLTPKAHSWPYKGFLYIYIYIPSLSLKSSPNFWAVFFQGGNVAGRGGDAFCNFRE